jgi:hypothetical protein
MTDPRQELQTLAASALMVGLHQAIEAYHEVVRGAKAAEHSRVSANAPCCRRWRRTASASWPSRSVCSGSSCTIATRGVVSADAKRPARRRRGVSSAQRRTPTRSLHANATWAMAVTTGAPSSESAAGAFTAAWVLHTGAPRPDSGQQRRHRSRRFKIAHAPARPNPPAACPCVVRPCMSACGAAYRQTSARMRSTAGSDVATYDPPVARCDSLRRRSTRGG